MSEHSSKQANDLAKRAIRAHNRMHGASTFIEARYMPHIKQVRVSDHELNIVTYWDADCNARRKVSFAKQIGERA